MIRKPIRFIFTLMVLFLWCGEACAVTDTYIPNYQATSQRMTSVTEEQRPVLTVTPREIDFGAVKPGDTTVGVFSLKNIAPEIMEWSTSCPDDWEGGVKNIQATVSNQPTSLVMELSVSENKAFFMIEEKSKIPTYHTRLRMEAAGKEIVCQKELKAGMHRKAIRITSTGGQRTIFVDFRIQGSQERPSLNVNPQRIDLGTQSPGKIISKRIELTNKGNEMLRWSVRAPLTGSMESSKRLLKERYFSFQNEEMSEKGKYAIPEHLKDATELIGGWTEKNGYPLSRGTASALKFRFHGTGISVFLQSHTENGSCSIYLDEVMMNLPDVLSGEWEKKELLIGEGLPEGSHTLTIIIREGSLEIEGVKILGQEIIRGPRGWITVFPNSGTTLSEKDYINIKVDTSNLHQGYYGDQVVFKSNAGEEIAEIFVDVVADATQKVIDIFLFTKDLDCMFTADPQSESRRLIQNGYVKEGIAFRLFAPQTPGTTSLFRWYNPLIRDHYYHYDRTGGGKKLDGYVYEGTIGNIATSRLANTKELYRWFNPSTGKHYYSTNPKGASGLRKGYRFEGIAGYVR